MIFSKKKNTNYIKYIIFIFVAFAINFFVNSTYNNNEFQTENYIEEAIQKSAFHCYAVEGSFPPNMEYLKKNYGILFNTDDYIVDYQYRGENIPPDIFVSKKGKSLWN